MYNNDVSDRGTPIPVDFNRGTIAARIGAA